MIEKVLVSAYFSKHASLGYESEPFTNTVPLEAFALVCCAIVHAIRRYHTGVKVSDLKSSLATYQRVSLRIKKTFQLAVAKGLLPADYLESLYKKLSTSHPCIQVNFSDTEIDDDVDDVAFEAAEAET